MENPRQPDKKQEIAQALYDYVIALFGTLELEVSEDHSYYSQAFFSKLLGQNVLFELYPQKKRLTVGVMGEYLYIPMEPNTPAYNEVLSYYKQQHAEFRGGQPLTVNSIALELDPEGLIVEGGNSGLTCSFYGRFTFEKHQGKRGFLLSHFKLGEITDETADLIENLLLAKIAEIIIDVANNPNILDTSLVLLASSFKESTANLVMSLDTPNAPTEPDPDILRALEEDDPTLLES